MNCLVKVLIIYSGSLGNRAHRHVVALLLQLLRLNEVDEQPQPVLEQVLNRHLVPSDELRPHEAVLVVLDQLTEVDHQSPWEWPLGL